MNTGSVVLGVVILLYGLMMLITRFTSPEKHLRLRFLRNALGDRGGNIIHTVVYIIAPFVLAYWLIGHGLDGESLKQIFTPPVRPE